MSLRSSPRTARNHPSLFIQSMDIKTLHYQTSAVGTFGLRWPPCGDWSESGGRRRSCGVPELCFVLPGGGHWRSASRFPRRQTPAPERIWMKECRPVAGEAFARALPARRPCELLTRAASSCTALSRWGGRRLRWASSS